MCTCNTGYTGDGFTCTPLPMTCSVMGDMGPSTDESDCGYGTEGDICVVQCAVGFLGESAIYKCTAIGGPQPAWVPAERTPSCIGK